MPSVIRSNECVMRHKNVCLAHLGKKNAIIILDIVFLCFFGYLGSGEGKIWHNQLDLVEHILRSYYKSIEIIFMPKQKGN